MNASEGVVGVSQHLMFFLVAVFALASDSLLSTHDLWTKRLYALALVLALLSFLVGYATMFRIFNDMKNFADDQGKMPQITHGVILRFNLQYALTTLSLLAMVTAVIRLLFYVP